MEGVAKVVCVEDKNGTFWRTPKGVRCPNSNWINDGSAMCILVKNGNPVHCDLCPSAFDCAKEGEEDNIGMCVVGGEVCGEGSVCEANECVYGTPLQSCECCCRKDRASEDCCSYWSVLESKFIPLTCGGECGDPSDNSIGKCMGCANAPDPDLACNCDGGFGKFCYTSDSIPEGVCVDCESLDSSEACSRSDKCCYDGVLNKCLSVEDRNVIIEAGVNYCSYNLCNEETSECLETSGILGGNIYSKLDECNKACTASDIGVEEECTIPEDEIGEDECGPGYQCFEGNLETEDNTGNCCCEIGSDDCSEISPSLVCNFTNDKDSSCFDSNHSEEPNFGICCGCESDGQCGDIENTGCGDNKCCYNRPRIIADSILPSEGSTVCGNSQISVDFDLQMDLSSIDEENMLLIGQYGTQCPSGTKIVLGDNKSKIEKIYYRIGKIIKKIASSVFGKRVLAILPNSDLNNYCLISGSVRGEDIIGETGSRAIFKPNKFLDSNRTYYVVVKGDANLDSGSGVLSANGVGLNGSGYQDTEDSALFNEMTFRNSHIWSFRTLMDGGEFSEECTIDHIDIEPKNYLFNTNVNNPDDDSYINTPFGSTMDFDSIMDSDKVFTATAIAKNGNVISPVVGVYSWTFDWDGNYSSLADRFLENNLPHNKLLLRVKQGVVSGRANIRVNANVSSAFFSDPEPAEAYFSVFICENPWPSKDSNNNWRPWMDVIDGAGAGMPNTDFEFYYCRDDGKEGTYDDLPVLDTGAIISGEAEEVYKEFYFFREKPLYISEGILSGEAVDAGKGVNLSWDSIPEAVGYNVYYGEKEEFENKVDVTNLTSVRLGEGSAFEDVILENDKFYFFAVSGYTDAGVETKLSNVVKILVKDSVAPITPEIINIERKEKKAIITWANKAEERPIFFKVFYRAFSNESYCHENTNFMSNGELIKVEEDDIIVGNEAVWGVYRINDSFKYCFGIAVYDAYENSSITTMYK